MKFRKFGKALLMSALSVGAVLSVTSCVQSYTVGFLYVTGTQTSGTNSQGIISGFKIDHNTGKLTNINGLPVASGGANPGRAVLLQSSRFLYVLNRGVDPSGGSNCTTTTPCTGSNITQFSVGGNGSLTPQQTFYTQGVNPFRIVADSTGSFIYVLDHDAPDSNNGQASNSCTLVLGSSHPACGDITVFKVDPTTGRLSYVVNAQVASSSGTPLAYFPVPSDPIDMVLTGGFMITLSGNSTTGDFVFPYTYTQGTGQLTVSQNSIQPINNGSGSLMKAATAIQSNSTYVYVLDNEPLTAQELQGGTVSSPSQIVPFTVGTGGALQAQVSGAVPDTATQSNPLFLLVESKNKWAYVANYGNNSTTNQQSGIAGYVIDPTQHVFYEMAGSPFGSGSGPSCLVEDPSNQFVYTANFIDSTVTGAIIDQNSGVLDKLPGAANKSYGLPGPAAYCLVNGRTS